MLELLTVLAVGVLVGALLCGLVLRRAALDTAAARLEAWRAVDGGRIRHRALDGGRFEVKSGLQADVLGPVDSFPFLGADTRFLGHPVTFVVFDGHSEVKGRMAQDLRGIVFVAVGDPQAVPDDALLVAECVAAGRVRWETLTVGPGPGQRGLDTSSNLPVLTS